MTSQMFSCQSKPDIPDENDTDAGLATYIVRLALAYDDCASQLSTVKNHLEINGVEITETFRPPAEPQLPHLFDFF